MGNSGESARAQPLSSRLTDRFTISSRDPEQGITYLSDCDSHHYILKQITSSDQSHQKWIEQVARLKIKDRNPYLLRLEDSAFQSDNNYCSLTYKSHLIFEKPFKDLRQEIKQRKVREGAFDSEQFMSVIETGTLGLKYLKSINHSHPSVSSSTILLSKEGVILLSDPWLNVDLNSPLVRHHYHCPESQEHRLSRQESIDWVASCLFSLGMIVLEMYYLQFMDDVYGPNREINYKVLNSKIDGVTQGNVRKYAQQLLGPKRKRLLIIPEMDIYAQHLKSGSKGKPKQQSGFGSIRNVVSDKLISRSDVVMDAYKNKIRKQNQNSGYGPSKEPRGKIYQSQTQQLYKGPHHQVQTSTKVIPTYRHQYSYKPVAQHHINYTQQVFRYDTSPIHQIMGPVMLKKQKLGLLDSQNQHPSSSLYYSKTVSNPNTHSYISPVLTSVSLVNHSIQSSIPSNTYPKPFTYQSSTFTGSPMLSSANSYANKVNESIRLPEDLNAKNGCHNVLQGYLPTQLSHTSALSQVDSAFNRSENETPYPTNQTAHSHHNSDILECSHRSPIVMVNSSSINQGKMLGHSEEVGDSRQKSSEQYLLRCQQSCQQKVAFVQEQPDPLSPRNSKQQSSCEINPCSPPQRQVNSTIMEVSDSQNKSEAQRGDLNRLQQDIVEDSNCSSQFQSESDILQIEYYPEGTRYEGKKRNGLKNGFGKYVYQDGAYVEGMWKDDQLNGHGKLYYASGKLAYDGQYLKGQFHGFGKAFNLQPYSVEEGGINYQDFNTVTQQWQSYQGDIKHQQKNGYGKLTYTNGDMFEGQFKQDRMNGKGKFTKADGQVVKGIWIDSRLVQFI